MMKINEKMIYVHIPFCETKCAYCNFVSFCAPQIHNDYFEKLYKEIASAKSSSKISSIFIGGGTPSSVNQKYITKLLKVIKQNFTLKKACEITIEVNPRSASLEKLTAYKKAGINRISFGVQSFDEGKLKTLGRPQTNKQVFSAIKNAKNVEFKNISADLMLGLMGQSKKEVVKDAKKLINLGVNHISAYMLILEESTQLYNMVQSGKITLPTDDESVDMYYALYDYLKSQGFDRYEISNFAKDDLICKHNMGYWQLKEYYGFGVSAHSYINKKRIANSNNVIDYFNDSNQTKEFIKKAQRREELILLGLRTNQGVKQSVVGKKRAVNNLIKDGFVKIKGDNIVICEDKFGLANQIILKLL